MERADKAIGLRLIVCAVLLSACLFSPIGNLFAAAPDQPVRDPWQELQTGPRPHNAHWVCACQVFATGITC